MPADIAGDFAAAGRMADQHHVGEIERVDHRGEIVGVVVQVVAVPGLAGATAAASVMRYRPETVRSHEVGRAVPDIGSERPAVAENDRLAGAPILVEDSVPSGVVTVGMRDTCREWVPIGKIGWD